MKLFLSTTAISLAFIPLQAGAFGATPPARDVRGIPVISNPVRPGFGSSAFQVAPGDTTRPKPPIVILNPGNPPVPIPPPVPTGNGPGNGQPLGFAIPYQPCSRTVTDGCLQSYEFGVNRGAQSFRIEAPGDTTRVRRPVIHVDTTQQNPPLILNPPPQTPPIPPAVPTGNGQPTPRLM